MKIIDKVAARAAIIDSLKGMAPEGSMFARNCEFVADGILMLIVEGERAEHAHAEVVQVVNDVVEVFGTILFSFIGNAADSAGNRTQEEAQHAMLHLLLDSLSSQMHATWRIANGHHDESRESVSIKATIDTLMKEVGDA